MLAIVFISMSTSNNYI